MKHAVRHIHFVGLGGSGMSGIAEVLHGLGYAVSGSDLSQSDTLSRLAALGITTYVGHVASQAAGADVVVTSSAIGDNNPEVASARALGIRVVPRAVMLAELMRSRQGIAIAGTHGKTTTTSLVTSVLQAAGLDPTFVIGGRLRSAASGAHLGRGDFMVVEADESDASFTHLLPVMAVVTNIDADHMETYGHDLARLQDAFADFLHRMPFYGVAILCTDNATVNSMSQSLQCRVLRYGFNEQAHVRAVDVQPRGCQMTFTVQRRYTTILPDLPVVLNLAGRHNVLNALSAIAVAMELGLNDGAVLKALAEFQGVGRRFERHGDVPVGAGVVTVIDDYGHHPVEIEATMAAARSAFPDRRLVLAFQPHRYTRTRDCFAEFVEVLGRADALLLSEVYSAGELPIAHADGAALHQALLRSGNPQMQFVPDIADLPQALVDQLRAGDVLLCMGAGSIGAAAAKVVHLLQKREHATQEVQAL